MSHLYQSLATDIVTQIENGHYQPGDKLPGIRAISRQRNVSIATTQSAFRLLEDDGWVEVRPRSGFYVRARQTVTPLVAAASSDPKPSNVTGQNMALRLIKAANKSHILQLGAAVPDLSFLPIQPIGQATTQALKRFGDRALSYEMPPGALELRRQIARRMGEAGCAVSNEEIVITNGCQEALTIALKAVTKAGDIVAIESPTFYGLLQVIESLGLEALEIPVDPQTGMSLEALKLALERWPIKACVVVANCSNPLGYTMPDESKLALTSLLTEYCVPLIEDDVYGDLSFDKHRPALCRSLAPQADIIYCSSFSKTLSPGLRVGWIAAGKHLAHIEYLKYVSNIATATLPQLTVAHFLESGRYDRYLRQARNQYARAVSRMTDAVLRYFPTGTRVSQPRGGFVIWVELPCTINTFELAERALGQGISIAPGPIFSAKQKFKNAMRLSCACKWDETVEKGLAWLGARIEHMQLEK